MESQNLSQDFELWVKERDRPIGRALVRRLSLFMDDNYIGQPLCCRKNTLLYTFIIHTQQIGAISGAVVL